MYELLSNPLMTYTHIAAKASVIRPAMHSVIIVFFQVRLVWHCEPGVMPVLRMYERPACSISVEKCQP